MAAAGLQMLKALLSKCRQTINPGSTDPNCGIDWLNNFCGDFYEFANRFHKYVACEVTADLEDNEYLDTTFLCLAQVCLCTKYLERVVHAEQTAEKTIQSSRRHFVDRIIWCLDKLESAAGALAVADDDKTSEQAMSSCGFMLLLDIAMDNVSVFSTYQESPEIDLEYALESSKEIHTAVRFMISHALALANVALFEDKTALSALCQKALRESSAFEQECQMSLKLKRTNAWNRRLKAIALGDSLTQLHRYVDETILRLIFICFADLEKFSLDKLRAKLRQCGSDDAELDEFIADFDVNLDRLAQIGLFAANESHSPKLKTLVRSCMASLEALDPCIIPSLQAGNVIDMHSEILEQHFYEEIGKLKTILFEIVDVKPISRCFYEILNTCVAQAEKQFNKTKLEDMMQMGEFLLQYFQYHANQKELHRPNSKTLEHFKKFTLMLHKFIDALDAKPKEARKNSILPAALPVVETNTIDLSESKLLLATIEPSVCSILYRDESSAFAPRKRAVSESMRGNYSKCPVTPLTVTQSVGQRNFLQELRQRSSLGGSVRRKESLRTVMFKRQKSVETQKACDFYLQNSASLQISEILDQLTQISEKSSSAAVEELLNTSRLE